MTSHSHQIATVKNVPIATCTVAQENVIFATLSSDQVKWNWIFKSMKGRWKHCSASPMPSSSYVRTLNVKVHTFDFLEDTNEVSHFSVLFKTIPLPGEKIQMCACFRHSHFLWMDADYAVPVEWFKIAFIVMFNDWRGQSLPRGKQL